VRHRANWQVLVAVIGLACVSDWPPNQAADRAFFTEHHSQFEILIDELQQDGLSSVELSGTELAPQILLGPYLSDARQREWVHLLQTAEVESVRRDGEDYFLDRSFEIVDAARWERSFVRRSASSTFDRPCKSIDRAQACGGCQIRLSGQWYASYVWTPVSDTDYEACILSHPFPRPAQ
jgi:hypothetical protein